MTPQNLFCWAILPWRKQLGREIGVGLCCVGCKMDLVPQSGLGRGNGDLGKGSRGRGSECAGERHSRLSVSCGESCNNNTYIV